MLRLAFERETLTPPYQEAEMVRRARVFIHDAIDLWLGELARQGRALSTRTKYRQLLDPFGDEVRHKAPAEVTVDDVRRYLDRWVNASTSTQALYVTVLRRFFEFCRDEGIVRVSPAERLKRPPRKRPEDTEVVTITDRDVRAMLQACEDWQELLCIAVLAYMGVRRKAAANARRRDVDLHLGTLRFVEKGAKVIVKPIPDELLAILRRADQLEQWPSGDAWLIPNRKPWLCKSNHARGDKVIYETVRRVADRAGVRSHVHAFRGAFAVQFDQAHPDQAIALKELLGHARIETTMVYLRRKDKAAAMETVRDLSFGLPASSLIPPAGFEPALPANPGVHTGGAVADAETLPDALLGRARSRAGDGKPSSRVGGR